MSYYQLIVEWITQESKGKGDLRQMFVFGRYDEPATKCDQPLPPALQRHKAEVDAFHKACYEGTCRLLDTFSVALSVRPHLDHDTVWLRS